MAAQQPEFRSPSGHMAFLVGTTRGSRALPRWAGLDTVMTLLLVGPIALVAGFFVIRHNAGELSCSRVAGAFLVLGWGGAVLGAAMILVTLVAIVVRIGLDEE